MIHIFANGGPSHVDTFDPKPILAKYAGKPLPTQNLKTERKTGAALPSPFKFKKYGQSGLEISELFEHTAKHADDLCVIRSMHADVPNHEPSLLLMNCGEARLVRPSFGSWVTYGLGTENQNLPGFVAMCPNGYPIQESQNWQAGFLPGVFQGTYIDTQHTDVEKLIENVRNKTAPTGAQRKQLDLLMKLNRTHQAERPNDPQLEARIQSFELAYRMQSEASDAFDVSKEPKHVLEAYGPGVQARQLLIARPSLGTRRSVRAGLARQGSAVGQSRRPRSEPPQACRPVRQGDRSTSHRSETTGPLRFHARAMGRGVRPDAGSRTTAGRVERRQDQRSRSQPLGLHRLARRRRGQRRPGLRSHRRIRLPGRGKQSSRPRSARDDAQAQQHDHEEGSRTATPAATSA